MVRYRKARVDKTSGNVNSKGGQEVSCVNILADE